MAFIKTCDYSKCGKTLAGSAPFLQFHGSVSEQIEDGEGGVKYRFLTPHSEYKGAVCNDECLSGLLNEWRAKNEFIQRPMRRY